MAGDFILAVASMMIARLKDNDVTLTLSQVSFIFCCSCLLICLLSTFFVYKPPKNSCRKI